MTLKESHIYTNRTTNVKTAKEKGIKFLKELGSKNVADLLEILKFNEANGLRFYRLSSDLFPHWGNPKVRKYKPDFTRLAEAGVYAKSHGHRITMHPGQYTQLGSIRDEVINQSIVDINNHAEILTSMGLSEKNGSVIIIHGGGVFGDKLQTITRIINNFSKLSKEAQQMVVFENDDYHYTIADLLPMCEQLQVPLCIDFFHHICNNNGDDVLGYIDRVMKLWRARGIKPKCHWSSQRPDSRKGAHSDCMESIPDYILETCQKHAIDIMIEAKDKELCTLRMYEKYFTKKIYDDGRIEWLYN